MRKDFSLVSQIITVTESPQLVQAQPIIIIMIVNVRTNLFIDISVEQLGHIKLNLAVSQAQIPSFALRADNSMIG
jgi:hypothetical protein